LQSDCNALAKRLQSDRTAMQSNTEQFRMIAKRSQGDIKTREHRKRNQSQAKSKICEVPIMIFNGREGEAKKKGIT
jgi:hypothetical protein